MIASGAISWLTSVDNGVLQRISNLLTILVITIGLIDWSVRKIRHRANTKNQMQNKPLDILESTQKPFKAVNMLNDPMGTSEKLGALAEGITKMIGGAKVKKVFKWIWYNKEQLVSIGYNAAIIVMTNFLMWTGMLNDILAEWAGAEMVLTAKIVALVFSVACTIVTIRNVCVTYGLSSLDTIDKVLAERAAEAERKLTPEQIKALKSNISILNGVLEKAKTELKTAETELDKITALYNADNSLVADFVVKRQTYEKKIAASKAVVANLEGKIADYKATLNGKTTETK